MEHLMYFVKKLYVSSGKKLIINVFGMVLISLLEGLGVLLLLPMISISGIADVNAGASPLSGIMNFVKEFPQTLGLPLILCMYILLIVGQNLLQRSLTIRDTSIQQRFVRHLRLDAYKALLQSNWIFFVRRRNSDLIHLLTSELTRVGFGTNLILQLITSVIFTLIQISIAFWLSPTMTIFVLSFGLLLTLFSRKFIKRARVLGGQTSQLSQSFHAGISDQLNGIKEIKSNSLEESRLTWFHALTRKMEIEQVEYIKLRSASQLLYKIASAVLIAAFIYLSVMVFHTQMEQLLLIFVIFSRLWPRFTGIQSNMEHISAALPAFKAIIKLQEECIAAKEFHLENGQEYIKVKPIEVNQEIECRHVSFRYNPNESRYALHDINFQIASKQTTAIVGRSGAGKSTLIDILMGLIQPENGQVLIDGIPLQSDQILALRQSISYVPQDPFLFHASIRENLLMIEPGATEKQLWEALEFSVSAEYVRRLPQGLDTIIGDRGVRLSGGERQRIVLARAILRKPSILIMDEATSALDTENEARIQEALDRLKGTMTIIVIAHRMSTIRNADQVIVLDQGEIVQKGGFNQLAGERGSVFSNLLGNQIPDPTRIA
ncbi:MAG: ABC transporter ATP-binding protein [Paenibacillaceae bacterium]